jgi:hypothetical protein
VAFELRYHNEYGVEVQLFRDGEFYGGRRFDLKRQALACAEMERAAREQKAGRSPTEGESRTVQSGSDNAKFYDTDEGETDASVGRRSYSLAGSSSSSTNPSSSISPESTNP